MQRGYRNEKANRGVFHFDRSASTYAQTTDFFELVKTGTAAADTDSYRPRREPLKLEDTNGATPLMYAALCDANPDVITALLKAGAAINARANAGSTALMWAPISNPNPEVTTVLLKADADVNARDMNCVTALMWAAISNLNPEVITTLLRVGVDAKAKDKTGMTAFDYARENNKLRGIDALRRLEEASQ